MTLEERIEQRINQGLLGHWYVVAKSVDLGPNTPLAVTRLGKRLVLWRDTSGKPHCVEDYCPHRGAPLSRGLVIDGQLSCRYHGVVVDGDGSIARVPAMPDCPLEGRKAVESFPVRELADGIFAYFPSVERPEPTELDPPEELTNDAYTHFLCTATWQGNYRYAYDNLADPMHGCYLHADTFTLAYGSKQDLMKLDKTEHGFIVRRVQQAGENFDWTEMVFGASTWCRLDLPYPKAAGPGGVFRIIGYCTPIDEHNCKVYFWRLRKIGGLEREAWRFMYRALLEERHWNVLEQDRVMLSAMPDDARMREMLYQHDVGVGALRQTLTRIARSQIEAEDAAAARPAAAG